MVCHSDGPEDPLWVGCDFKKLKKQAYDRRQSWTMNHEWFLILLLFKGTLHPVCLISHAIQLISFSSLKFCAGTGKFNVWFVFLCNRLSVPIPSLSTSGSSYGAFMGLSGHILLLHCAWALSSDDVQSKPVLDSTLLECLLIGFFIVLGSW
jgi:hypothetical protein